MDNFDDFIEVKIFLTKNYDQFSFLPENRPVTGSCVGKSILRANLLADNPILVTPRREVLDGQNRLIFAKNNNLLIYYKIAMVTTREHISLLQNHDRWQLFNHAHFYKESPVYDFIADISEKYDLSLYFVIGCCDPTAGAADRFKNGEMVLTKSPTFLSNKFELLHEIISKIQSLLFICDTKKRFISTKFNRALWAFIDREDYDHNHLMHRIQTKPDTVFDILTINSETLIYESLEKLFGGKRKAPAKR